MHRVEHDGSNVFLTPYATQQNLTGLQNIIQQGLVEFNGTRW